MDHLSKVLVLFSGGLDSTLAAKVLAAQGIEVTLIHFQLPFYSRDYGQPDEKIKLRAVELGFPIIIIPAEESFDEYWQLLINPDHGYGRFINPCIDCHLFMCRQAKKYFDQTGASFLATGEVLKQRPMSQHLDALNLIDRRSNIAGLILRPLSAKLLPPTIPEQKGWVDRERLYDFTGRSRRPQMELAERLGVTNYPNAAGGCLLTEEKFAKRLKDLLEHGSGQPPELRDLYLLKIGRHLRLSPRAKLIVGRNEAEDNLLKKFARTGDLILEPPLELNGASALGQGQFAPAEIALAGRICARYIDKDPAQPEEKPIVVSGLFGDPAKTTDHYLPADTAEIAKYLL